MKTYEVTVEKLMSDGKTVFCEEVYLIMARTPEDARAIVNNKLVMDYEPHFRISVVEEVTK